MLVTGPTPEPPGFIVPRPMGAPHDALGVLSMHSQPLPGTPSTSKKLAAQPVTTQLEPPQPADAFGRLHGEPHAPQLLTSLLVSISQPSGADPLQSRNDPMHAKPQALPLHDRIALARAGQTLPQPPQLERSAVVLTSQPST